MRFFLILSNILFTLKKICFLRFENILFVNIFLLLISNLHKFIGICLKFKYFSLFVKMINFSIKMLQKVKREKRRFSSFHYILN
jgi:hypothetical protein